MNVPCKICQKKRARRYCPGVGGDICAVCCGTARETTIDCPSHCEYLQEARVHERMAPISADQIPHQDIRITEEFVEEHVPVIALITLALIKAMDENKAVDRDAGEAFEAMIKTLLTLQSGLIYETQPQNPYAASIQQALKQSIEELKQRVAEKTGLHTLRDADVVRVLVFLQRLQIQYNNGRPRSRAFYDFVRASFPMPAESPLLV